MKVQSKVIVVTGGGSGIGRELVLNLLSKGARIAAVDISESGLQETLELAGDRKGYFSLRIDQQWRLCFRFESGSAFDVEIVDYH